ncbi:MAG: YtxH domain-containing protein [Candidatus Saccharibacteria bacterium]|nr:YtxH domain-containing protein [Candidatus Saccharibacteria bacterium]
MSKGTGKCVLGAEIGAAIGVVAGWFTAPKAGKDMRADAKQKAQEVYDKGAEFVDGAKEKVSEISNQAKDKFGWLKQDKESKAKK